MSRLVSQISKLIPPSIQQRLQQRGEAGKIADNSAWLLTEQLLRMGLAFTVGLLVTRYLGPERYGTLSYAVSFAAIIAVLAKLGLDALLVRDLVGVNADTPAVLSSALGLKLLAGLLTTLLTIGLGLAFIADHEVQAIIAISAIGTTLMAFEVATFWFQAQQQARPMALLRIAVLIVLTAVKVGLLLSGAPLFAFAWLMLAETALPVVTLYSALMIMRPELRRWRWRGDLALTYLREGWPVLISNAMVMLYLRVDQVMIGFLSSSTEVGYYAAAVRFSEIWGVIPTSIAWAAFPALVRARAQSEALFAQRVQALYDGMVLGALVVALSMTVIAVPLINLLLGPTFAPAAPILMIHVWSSIFVFLELVRGKVLITWRLTGAYSLSTVLGVGVNVALNLLLIPSYGGIGAAIATLVAYGMVTLGASLVIPALRPEGRRIMVALLIPYRLVRRALHLASKDD
jgi:O-antigen/teichoic acid export membrane protein